jgi:hypothetical protein
MEDLMKISFILCLILFVSCGKVKIGQMEKKGALPEGRINQPQRAGGDLSGSKLDEAKRICSMLNQKLYDFKSKYAGGTFHFKVVYKDCKNNGHEYPASAILNVDGSNLVYQSREDLIYKNEDSDITPNFKEFCENLKKSPSDVVQLPNETATRRLYTISNNSVTIDKGEKVATGWKSKLIQYFEINGSGEFSGMISSYRKLEPCANAGDESSSQTQTVTGKPIP